MCTTAAKCKTFMTDVLTVMSGMDPHMISGTWDLVWLSLGFGLSVTVRLCDVIKVVILRS
jgi:hypothetical protein